MAEEKNNTDAVVPEAAKQEVKLPDTEKLIVSSSPHLHEPKSIRKIMILVLIALAPASLVGIYFFGIDALRVIFWCTFFSVLIEVVWCYLAGKPLGTWKDCSAIVTGVILALNLSAGVPWWLCLVGAFLAIVLGKQIYGGIGYNPFNPAIVARVGLLIGFPKLMTTWVPTRFMPYKEFGKTFSFSFDKQQMTETAINTYEKMQCQPFFKSVCDGVTCATPLGTFKTAEEAAKATGVSTSDFIGTIANSSLYWDYFWGNVGGCLGETSVIALLIGGIFLIALKLIRWQLPVAYIGTVVVFTAIVHGADPLMTPNALFHVLTGGLMLGAFFCATDMVTSPMTIWGGVIFGIGCGVVTCLIRIWGNYPEGVSFSILFMNAWVPLIDRFARRLPFGFRHPEKAMDGGEK